MATTTSKNSVRSDGKGGASAPPAVSKAEQREIDKADQWEADALAAIDVVQDPVEAEKLLGQVDTVAGAMRHAKHADDRERRWAGIKLKAEARYGELLPKRSKGGRGKTPPGGGSLSKADEHARARARKVAEAKQADPQAFADYVENEAKPTRTGLLRELKKPTDTPKPKTNGKRKAKGEPTIAEGDGIVYDPDVFTWVRDRFRRGWSRDRIVAATRDGEDGWLVDRWPQGLGNTGVDAIRIAIYHVEQFEKLNPKRRRPKYSGRAMREVAAARKRPNYPKLHDVRHRVLQLTTMLDTTDVESYDLDEEHVIRDLYEDLIELQFWMDHTIAICDAHLDDAQKLATIRKLRATNGRTDAEAETALNLANKLEAKLAARLDNNA